MTDLIDPVQLFVLSTKPTQVQASRGGHFDPTLFPEKAAVLACVASTVVPGETDLSNAHPLDAGVRYADFDGGTTDDSGSGFTSYGQWYAANGYVYMLFLWVGPAAKDWDAMPAVVDTIRFSA
ncbi:MAG: hypothetical protein M3540_14130 [Actinomycetota bacterium]|nr:hypothetical protein [Actinomycetota bacterium]